MPKRILIFISGIDGTGKTTVSNILYTLLKNRGIPVVKIWFRFPYFFSFPLLLLAKKIGLTRTLEAGVKIYTVHFFESIEKIYTSLFLLDFMLHYIIRVIIRLVFPLVLIVERGPIDSLADLYSDISLINDNKYVTLTKLFLKLQKRGITITTQCKVSTLKERRPETNNDPKFYIRYNVYKNLFGKLGHSYININTDKNIEKNRLLLEKITSIVQKNYGYVGYGKLFANPYFKSFFANKWIIFLTNWFFQGFLIADYVENVIRILIDIIVPLFIYIKTSNVFYLIIGIVVSHSINYIFNSNSMHVIRFFKKEDPNKIMKKFLNILKSEKLDKIEAVVIFGSYVRDQQGSHSDIDVRIIRKASILNAFRAYLLTTKLRLIALKNHLPLDIFIHDENKLCKIVKYEEILNLIVYPEGKKEIILKKCNITPRGFS